eukprot:symbB.v1.2.018093.t1/scaffold1431.1/size119194/7
MWGRCSGALLLAVVESTIISIPLERKAAPFGYDGAASKTFYVGKMQVGNMEHPQELQVAFETASGSMVLDSTHCQSPACMKHRQYMPTKTSAQLNRAGGVVRTGEQAALTIDYNEESHASGVVVGDMMRDKICIGSERHCADVGFLAAANMTDDPFTELPVDGIVGLSMEGLSISSAFNFLHCITAEPITEQSFGLFLPKHGFGEISFGGYNPRRLSSPISWVSVQEPAKGFWQVAVKGVYVGTEALDFCRGGCRAIVDSSSSHFTVPSEVLPTMQKKLAVTAAKGWLSERPLCEQAVGPTLTFALEDGMNLTLTAKEYSALEGQNCVAQLHPWDIEERRSVGTRREGQHVVAAGVSLQTIVLGEPILRKYYTIFDATNQRMGFGVASTEAVESDEIILMQSAIRKKAHEL